MEDSSSKPVRPEYCYFVVKTIGIRKRRFDRSTVIIKQSEDKIYIGTNYIVEQRSDKCKKHENVKKRGI